MISTYDPLISTVSLFFSDFNAHANRNEFLRKFYFKFIFAYALQDFRYLANRKIINRELIK